MPAILLNSPAGLPRPGLRYTHGHMDAKIAYIERLGGARYPSPLPSRDIDPEHPNPFVADSHYIPLHITRYEGQDRPGNLLFEKAGPRESIFFDPERTAAAIVTCGGLCPGLNNVIRSLVFSLRSQYGVTRIYGIRYGYHGLNPANGFPPVELTAEMVSDIHEQGGTILGTSRGPEDPEVMVQFLRDLGVSILFPIGGDGTQRGAYRIHEAACELNYPLAVAGIPKTIDNDILYVSRTFGYGTAINAARQVIDVAHTEARAVLNGIGLVKLMGRDSGFIAAGATLASGEVNYCLIPEQPFELEGERGLLAELERRLERKRHAVIVVAEGAGQHLIPRDSVEKDASGNIKHADIGLFLKDRINGHFRAKSIPVNVRYIDPSYMIRGLPADTEDSILCDGLARNAVHAAMTGRSGLIIGFVHNRMVHVPSHMIAAGRKTVSLDGELWKSVLAVTGQPAGWK